MLRRQDITQTNASTLDSHSPDLRSRGESATQSDSPKITIFSIPKPFEGSVATIQNNAIRSWAMLAPHVHLMLFGEGDGVRRIAKETGADLLPVRVNEFGTPILSDAFQKAHASARGELMVYANTDILFGPELLEVWERLAEYLPRALEVTT